MNGIHFRSDLELGLLQGQQVATLIYRAGQQ